MCACMHACLHVSMCVKSHSHSSSAHLLIQARRLVGPLTVCLSESGYYGDGPWLSSSRQPFVDSSLKKNKSEEKERLCCATSTLRSFTSDELSDVGADYTTPLRRTHALSGVKQP